MACEGIMESRSLRLLPNLSVLDLSERGNLECQSRVGGEKRINMQAPPSSSIPRFSPQWQKVCGRRASGDVSQ